MEWFNYPQKITKWGSDIDYFMFVDENGSAGRITNIFQKITNGLTISDDEKFFTITVCIFNKKEMKNYNIR